MKEYENEVSYSKMGFSNLGMHYDHKESTLNHLHNDSGEKLTPFGEIFMPKSKPKSPYKATDSNFPYKFYRTLGDEGGNHSMLGVIDEQSNNNEHRFMFNDRHGRNDDHSMNNMFRNQNSNSFLIYQGTPKKNETSQPNIFDNNEHSNMSAMFPGLESNTVPKKLFQKESPNEPINFGGNSLNQKLQTPTKEIEPKKDRKDKSFLQELMNKQFLQLSMQQDMVIDEPKLKEPEGMTISWNQNPQEE